VSSSRSGIGQVSLLFAVFLGVSGSAFVLAKLHLARPGLPKAVPGQKVVLGDFYNGQTVFLKTCASCHGQNAQGSSIAPRLAGMPIALVTAMAQIDNGGSVMPAHLVSGRQERDVLAYLATILKTPTG
jgi:mono/diheme cytochrome c family protein